MLDALSKMRTPMDAQTFNAAREAFLYHVAVDTQTPQERADNLGWYSVEGNVGYAPGHHRRKLRSVGSRRSIRPTSPTS